MVTRQPHPSNRTRPLRPTTDYVLARLADDTDNYQVSPTQGKSLAQINLENGPPEVEAVATEETREACDSAPDQPLQFSVLDLLVVLTFAAVGLAGVQWLPSGIFAGMSGLIAFLTLVVGGALKPKRHITRLLLWAVVTVYVFASVGALVAQLRTEKAVEVQLPASETRTPGEAPD